MSRWEVAEHTGQWLAGLGVIAFAFRREQQRLDELKQLNTELAASEQRWRSALESAGDGLWEGRIDTDEAYFSPRWKAMLGFADSEFPNRSSAWVERIHPEDRARVDAAMQLHAAGKAESYECEYRLRCKDGNYLWVLSRGRMTSTTPDGRPVRAVGTHTDIHARRLLQEQVRASQERYRFLVEHANDAFLVFRLQPDGRPSNFIEVNAAACRLGGYTREALLAQSPLTLEVPVAPEEIERRGQLLAATRRLSCESEVLAVDGRRIPVEMHSEVIELDGQPTILSNVRDISARRAAEAMQRKDAEQARFLLALHVQAATAPERQLFELVAESAARLADSGLGFVHSLAGDRTAITHTTWSKLEPADGAAREGSREALLDASRWLECVRERRPVVANSSGAVATPPAVRRFVMLPVLEGGRVRQILGVALKETDYTAGDVTRLQLLVAELQEVLARRRADRGLAESEARYRELFESNPHPMYIYDAATLDFLAVNDATVRHYGFSREEFLQKTLRDIRSPEEVARMERVLRELAPGQTKTGIWRHLKKSGEEIAVEISTHTIVWGGRNARFTLAVDVTERVRAAAAVERSEAALRVAQRVAALGSWTWHIPSGRLEWSQEMHRVVGIPPEQFTGHVSDLRASAFHPDDAVSIEQAFRNVAEDGSLIAMEVRIMQPDGSARFVWAEIGAVKRDAAGRPVEASGIAQDVTERKRSELALRASEQRYRLLVENVSFPVVVTALKSGRILFANQRANALLTGSAGRLEGQPGVEYWAEPAERAKVVQEILAGREVFQREVALRPAQGGQVWVEMSANQIDFDGLPAVFAVLNDITARKLAVDALRHSERQLSLAMELAQAGSWEYDGATQLLRFTDRLFALYGTTAEREGGYEMAMAHYIREFVAPDDQHVVTRAVHELQTTTDERSSWMLEHRIRRRDGAIRHLVVNITAVADASGRVIGSRGVNQDITERQEADAALRESEERFRALVEGSDIATFLTLEMKFSYLNPAALRLFGAETPELLLGQLVLSRVHPSHHESIRNRSVKVLAGQKGMAPPQEEEYLRLDGTSVWVEATASPITYQGQRGAVVFLLDITERRKAQAMLRASQRELELFFSQSLDGFGFMMLDAPVAWDAAADQEALLNYIFAHERVTRANEALLAQYGATREQFIGRTPADFMAHDLDSGREVWRQLYATGRLHIETHERRLDGTPVWIEGDHICLRDAQGRITGHFSGQRDITRRKHAESELLRSQNRLARAMEFGRMAGWEFDVATESFTLNDQFYLLFGTTAPREGGYVMPAVTYLQEFIPAADAAVLQAVVEEIRRAGGGAGERQLEHRFRRRDGQIRHMHVRVTAISDATGRVVGARGVNTDITERVESEFERRRLSRAVEQSPVAVVITNPTGVIEYANPQFTKVSGYTLEDVLGKTPRVLKSGVQSEAFYREMWTTISSGKEWLGELCNRRKDGSLFWEEVNISPVFDDTGRIVNYIAVKEHITARRETSERLREQAALLDVVGEAIIVIALDRKIRYWNHGAEIIYGWSVAEAVGRDLHALVYDQSHPVPGSAEEALYAKGQWRGELTQRTKSGATLIVLARGVVMRDAHGTPVSVLLTATDITESKRLEGQYLRAQRLESVGALASGVAHDLNNVLSPILMSIELLRPLAVTAQDQEALRLMTDSARRGADVVRQLLIFGRGSDAPSEQMNVTHVVKEIVRMMRETFPRNLTIFSQIPRDVWPIRGHATQIYQILLNLCVNARDAMPGGGKLSVEVRNLQVDDALARLIPRAQAGRYIQIVVTDTGVGIPVAILDRIFDPFFTTKDQGKGTGLGLSTAVGIAKSHGGFITVNSREGQGSEFQVHLPALEESAGTAVSAPTPGAGRGRNETLLLVDDEVSIRHVLGRVLADQGYRVLIAASGDEALVLARRHQAELRAAIIDMMMPGLDGPQTVRALRGFAPGLPIIACSGLEKYADELANLGFARLAFLRKPFLVPQLLELLRAELDAPPPAATP